jgi:hypothetical protein
MRLFILAGLQRGRDGACAGFAGERVAPLGILDSAVFSVQVLRQRCLEPSRCSSRAAFWANASSTSASTWHNRS